MKEQMKSLERAASKYQLTYSYNKLKDMFIWQINKQIFKSIWYSEIQDNKGILSRIDSKEIKRW